MKGRDKEARGSGEKSRQGIHSDGFPEETPWEEMG